MTGQARVRLAAGLWLLLAFLVWNVVFDRVLVLAGREYAHDAVLAFAQGRVLRIDDVMRPAVRHGVSLATVIAAPIALFGLAASWAAGARYRARSASR